MSAPVAVVTGAAGNVGSRLLGLLAADGYDVRGLDRRAHDGVDMCDLTDQDAVDAYFSGLQRLDLLVLCAGLSAIGGLEDHALAVHRQVMDVTHFAALACLLAALPLLRQSRGRVVLVGSVAGFAPVLGRPAYVAAKHAVVGLFEAARPELEAAGVGLSVVHPTFIAGGMSEAVPRDVAVARAVAGVELTPDQVARAIVGGIRRRRDLVLVGRTARLAYLVHRHAPGLYLQMMKRRLGRPEGGLT